MNIFVRTAPAVRPGRRFHTKTVIKLANTGTHLALIAGQFLSRALSGPQLIKTAPR
jgi:hypothetical protein